MNDMSQVIVPKSDQINADDLISGPRTIRITEVSISPGTEQPVSIFFEGDGGKPWRPCKSMSRVLVAAWGPDAKVYVGRSVTLYRDPKVKWGGMEVGGIRISHLSHIDRDMLIALTATKGKRAPYTVKPLAAAQQPAQADRVADGARALVERIGQDPTALNDPTVIKQRAWLAANRPELAAMVDAAAEAASATEADPFGLPPVEEVRAEKDHGDQHDGVSDAEADILAHIARKTTAMDVNSLVSSRIGELGDEAGQRVRDAALARIAEIEEAAQ